MKNFTAIVAEAKRITGMTAAEFDYNLCPGLGRGKDGAAVREIDNVISRESDGTLDGYRATHAHYRTEFDQLIEAAKAKTYTGWSTASTGPIRYAR